MKVVPSQCRQLREGHLSKLLRLDVLARSGVMWLAFMGTLWTVFAVGVWTHPDAWNNIARVDVETGWGVLAYIIAMNATVLLLIVVGNVFVRFGSITPGILVLGWQAITIGWTAGTNAFSEPFASVAQANAAFLRIGLWETTAYVLICAVTLDKSLNVSDSFPARRWTETRRLRDLNFSRTEIVVAALSLTCLLVAALVEAFYRR
jgi:hypothetical protein